MWRREEEDKLSDEMTKILSVSPQARTTIKLLLCDCKTEEIVKTLLRINGMVNYHQKIVMMRQELARRNPDYAKMRHHDIPLEDVFAWEMVCKPFRELYKKKRERENEKSLLA